MQFFGTVVETAIYMPRETFWRKKLLLGKTNLIVIFGPSTKPIQLRYYGSVVKIEFYVPGGTFSWNFWLGEIFSFINFVFSIKKKRTFSEIIWVGFYKKATHISGRTFFGNAIFFQSISNFIFFEFSADISRPAKTAFYVSTWSSSV